MSVCTCVHQLVLTRLQPVRCTGFVKCHIHIHTVTGISLLLLVYIIIKLLIDIKKISILKNPVQFVTMSPYLRLVVMLIYLFLKYLNKCLHVMIWLDACVKNNYIILGYKLNPYILKVFTWLTVELLIKPLLFYYFIPLSHKKIKNHFTFFLKTF
jgi:hypothetical protein